MPEQQLAPKSAPLHIPSLDGLRAVSFFIVFLSHVSESKWVPGYFGLTVFFFLSGYLITTLLRTEYDKSGTISLGQFYLRRVLRIFPPFYIVLAAASALTYFGVLENTLQPAAVLAQVSHLSNYYIVNHGWWTGRAPGTWVYWSLAVEEHFYLVFPVVYLWMRRSMPSRKVQFAVLVGLCASVLAWRCVLVLVLHAAKDRTYVATDTRIDSIVFGCMLAIFANPVLDSIVFSKRRLTRLWLPVAAIALMLSFCIRIPQFEQTFRYTIQSIALFPVFISAIVYPNWACYRVLNRPYVRFIGTISYTLYLVHTTVIFGLKQWLHLPTFVIGVLALSLSMVLATMMYYGIEVPCARLRKQLSKRKSDQLIARSGRISPLEAAMAAKPGVQDGGSS